MHLTPPSIFLTLLQSSFILPNYWIHRGSMAAIFLLLFLLLSAPLKEHNPCAVKTEDSFKGSKGSALSHAPKEVKIGALMASHTRTGRSALHAMQLALAHINQDPSLLNRTHLSLLPFDTGCSAFQAVAAAVELLKLEVVAIAGPQCSSTAHFLAHMAKATQVPLVSFAATDPSLAEHQYSFFCRLAHNDAIQMKAIAAIIQKYGWREVVAIYSDNDYGTNGLLALTDALGEMGLGIMVQKKALAPGIDKSKIENILLDLYSKSPRVFVVHLQQDMAIKVLSEAFSLKLMSSGFVWILTDSLISTLDMMYRDSMLVKSTQGIIGTRNYIPESFQLQRLTSDWEKLQDGDQTQTWNELHSYSLNSYDSMWVIARALDQYFTRGGAITFKNPPVSDITSGGASELAKLRIFKGGKSLHQLLLETKSNGTSGSIQFDENGDRIGSSFEVVNMIGRSLRVVGYWSKDSGLSTLPPDSLHLANHDDSVQEGELLPVIWPGGGTQVPKGWAIPQNAAPLLIGVPKKGGYKELIGQTLDAANETMFEGFCINVFEAALSYLPYPVSYKFVPYGSGNNTPSYDDLIQLLSNKVFDGVVADATITKERLALVDFTQPYTESGLVVVVPQQTKETNNVWAFLRPFSPAMWLTTGIFLLFTGAVIWLLEHRVNYDFRGHPQRQVATALWFIFSTLFFAQREKTRSSLGRIVLIIWLFVVLIINSSYTASLTSILTVQRLYPMIRSLENLLESDVPIGYQYGSFVREYLIALHVDPKRLRPLNSIAMYAKALAQGPKNGGVAAIIDELPYVKLFLASECNYTIVGQEFTKGGWGFAFQKHSYLAIDMSEAILTMSRNGELQKIHDLWFTQPTCASAGDEVQSRVLDLGSFWGLFLLSGLASASCICLYIYRLFHGFHVERSQRLVDLPQIRGPLLSRINSYFKEFVSYVDKPLERHDSKRKEDFSQTSLETSSSNIKYAGTRENFDAYC